jgi:TRAP-type C4-dicarboxylate transport system permease small subunit
MTDGQYWNITLYYLIFVVVNLGLSYLLFRGWRDHVSTWKSQQTVRQALLLLVSALLLLFSSLVLGFIFCGSFEAWKGALDPDTPAPLFELFWSVGLPVVTLPAGIAGMLQALVRKEYEQLLP